MRGKFVAVAFFSGINGPIRFTCGFHFSASHSAVGGARRKIFAGQFPHEKPSREIARSRLRPLEIVFPRSQFKITFDNAGGNFQTGANQSGFRQNPVFFRPETEIYQPYFLRIVGAVAS